MNTIERRPFTAATDKLAYAQAFSRSTLVRRDVATARSSRRLPLLHRRAPRDAAAR